MFNVYNCTPYNVQELIKFVLLIQVMHGDVHYYVLARVAPTNELDS